MSEFHSLANLIKRLEVATTRLEDLAMSSSSATTVAANATHTTPTTTDTAVPASNEIPPAVEEHDAAIQGALDKYISLSEELGGVVAEQAHLVKQAVDAERDIIYISTLSQKPDMSSGTFMKLLEPIQTALSGIIEIKDKNRPSPFFNHLSVVAEGIPALGWFTCEPTPVPFIKNMKEAAQFYSNRVSKEWKDKEPVHVEWAQSFLAFIESLAGFVKAQFTVGLSWNSTGEKPENMIGKSLANEHDGTSSIPPPPPVSDIPPPPPPPPPMVIPEGEASSKPQGAAAVFAEINKGSSVTAKLRKVDKSEMIHKNPSLRQGSVVSAPGSPPKRQGPPTPNKPDKYILKKAAKTSLEANKWVVENHENNSSVLIEDTAINQAVYIYNCKNSTICIKGKVNAVTIDSCVKCGIAVDSTVSTVDIVNCKSFALQVFNVTPTIAIDKCDSGEIYLSKNCLGVEILSAKSTSLNVLLPEGDADDAEFKEVPVPEQFKTTIVDGKLVTVTIEHTG